MEKYDHAAAGWAQILTKIGTPDAYERMLSNVFQAHQFPKSDALRVLDCGVGTGSFSHALHRALKRPIALDAVDISSAMLEQAHAVFKDHGIPATLKQCDVRKLPYPDHSFDIVISAHLIEHLPSPEQAIAEMARVLKPGGLMIVCMTSRSLLGAYIQLIWRTHRVALEQAQEWLRRAQLIEVHIESFDHKSTASKMSIACIGQKAIEISVEMNGEINE